MTPERWQRVNELFQAALECEPDRREALLRDACDDLDLRQEVASLLEAHEGADGFLAASAAEGAPTLESGARLGPYAIVGLIGAGGMGEVYRARDPRLDREVAIKVLRAGATEDASRRRRFEQEARAAGALNHPNILTVYDVGAEGGIPYVVSELLEGETLRSRLARGVPTWPQALDWARQLATGLIAAHQKGIVHRDLKPDNLFLTADGRLKVLDFGLAKLARSLGVADDSTRATQSGILVGTIGYMSPEQVKSEPADHRVDVFAFGAVLYEMLTGRRAFGKGASGAVLSAILVDDPPALSSVVPDVPSAMEALVRRCLMKKPDERFQSFRDVAFALDAVEGGGLDTSSGSPPTPAIAVLPFANLGSEPDQEYFCQGLAEELMRTLARIEGVKVAARTSTFRFRDAERDLQRLGRELRVDRVVEGSVRRSGRRLRVSVRLVDVADGYQLWSERYDREIEDVFAVQDDIAARVAETLRPALTAAERARQARHRPKDLEAYHLYLRGRHAWNKRHEGSLQSAVGFFEEAALRDPGYAAALAGVADTYDLLGLAVYGVLPPHTAMPKAKAAAERALALDAGLADAYAARAWARFVYDWDWTGAEDDFRKSLSLDPDRGTSHNWYSFYLSAMGRVDEAVREAGLAWDADPLSLIINSNLPQPLYYGRRLADALAAAEKAVAMDAAFGVSHYWLGLVQSTLGRYREAAASHERHAALTGRRGLGLAGHAWASAGEIEKARGLLEKLENESREGYVPAVDPALVCIGLGERDAAFAWLDKALEERCDQLAYLNVDSVYDSLRDDRRFAELVRRVGLPS